MHKEHTGQGYGKWHWHYNMKDDLRNNLEQDKKEEGEGLSSELLCISEEHIACIFKVKMMVTTHETTAVSKFIYQD